MNLPAKASPFHVAKSALLDGVSLLASITEYIDDMRGPITDAIKANFNFGLLKHAEGVKAAISFVDSTKALMAKCDERIKLFQDEKKRLKSYLEEFERLTKEAIEANQGLPFAADGSKIAIRKNGGIPKLVLAFGDAGITPDMAASFQIPDRFLKLSLSIDKDAVRQALNAGETVPWAVLERGEHVDFRP